LIRPIHIEILPSSTHYRWMLQPLSLWLQDGNEGRGGREEKVIRYWLTLISGLGTAYTRWMKVLARLRMDGTYNQTQPLQYLRRKKKIFSFYLKAATDSLSVILTSCMQGCSEIPLQLPGRSYFVL